MACKGQSPANTRAPSLARAPRRGLAAWLSAVRWSGLRTEAIELKVWRDNRKDPLPEGLKQLDEYLSRVGLANGVLILFDRRTERPPLEERVQESTATTPSGREVRVLRA